MRFCRKRQLPVRMHVDCNGIGIGAFVCQLCFEMPEALPVWSTRPRVQKRIKGRTFCI